MITQPSALRWKLTVICLMMVFAPLSGASELQYAFIGRSLSTFVETDDLFGFDIDGKGNSTQGVFMNSASSNAGSSSASGMSMAEMSSDIAAYYVTFDAMTMAEGSHDAGINENGFVSSDANAAVNVTFEITGRTGIRFSGNMRGPGGLIQVNNENNTEVLYRLMSEGGDEGVEVNNVLILGPGVYNVDLELQSIVMVDRESGPELMETGTADLIMQSLLAGDANASGTVNLEDLATLATNFGMSGKTWFQGDFTGDGVVDLSDLAGMATFFGQSNVIIPPAEPLLMQSAIGSGAGNIAIPEPGMLSLLGLMGLGLVRRKRC